MIVSAAPATTNVLQKLRTTQPLIGDHSPLVTHRPAVANGRLRSEATADAIANFSRPRDVVSPGLSGPVSRSPLSRAMSARTANPWTRLALPNSAAVQGPMSSTRKSAVVPR